MNATVDLLAPTTRLEDHRLLTGAAHYVGDVPLDGVLVMRLVRSTVAHGRLRSIDATAALAVPGVVAVLTAADLRLDPQLPTFVQGMVDELFRRPPLAVDVVRFVGEIIAVVVADTAAAADDGAEMIDVDIEPLPAVVDPALAGDPASTRLFDGAADNVPLHDDFEAGSVPTDPALHAITLDTSNQRIAPSPMEPLAMAAVPSGDGCLTLYASTQVPHWTRDHVAVSLGIAAEDVRVIAPAVGGAFGAKTAWEIEYVITSAVARLLQRPVRYVQTREENLMTSHARGQRQRATLYVADDGLVHAMDVSITCDAGAYPAIGAMLPFMTRLMSVGVYGIGNVRWSTRSVLTNTAPTGAFRGAGRPEATSLIERAMDVVAHQLGIDPADIRRRNMLPASAMPYTTPTGAVYDSGDYAAALQLLLDTSDYAGLREEQCRRRAAGDRVALGLGLSTYVEVTAGKGGDEFAQAALTADGFVEVLVGTMSHGQGHATTYTQLVCAQLGIPAAMVRIVQGDTALVPTGGGTQGSRSIQLGGSAVADASGRLHARLVNLVADQLEVAPDDVVSYGAAGMGVRGVPASALDWVTLHARSLDRNDCEPGLASRAEFTQTGGTFPYGAHLAVVEVDLGTGAASIRDFFAVDDCGTVINPTLADGQLHGGIAAGISQALYEGVEYDESGTPLTTTFATYLEPAACDLPSAVLRRTEVPSPLNPLGAKGVGESGTVGSTPAVQNAVVDAVSHLGVRHIDMPLSPCAIWQAMQHAAERGDDNPIDERDEVLP